MAGLGWFGLALPEEYGGQGMPLTYLAIIMEEAGRAIAPVPFHSTMAAALAIAGHGTEEQRREVLPAVSRGDMILTWALTETDPRLRPQGVRLEAREDGDDLVLSGTKMFVGQLQRCRQVHGGVPNGGGIAGEPGSDRSADGRRETASHTTRWSRWPRTGSAG